MKEVYKHKDTYIAMAVAAKLQLNGIYRILRPSNNADMYTVLVEEHNVEAAKEVINKYEQTIRTQKRTSNNARGR